MKIKKKAKASKLMNIDLFNSKFFVEDFLEDINSNSIIE